MRIVLDTTILVRATEKSHGPARELLLKIIASKHILLLSNEMLYELAKVLRYPRLIALYGLSEARVYDFIAYLRRVADIVTLSPLLTAPCRDVNNIVVLQTAVIGEANILCTRDDDFYSRPLLDSLRELVSRSWTRLLCYIGYVPNNLRACVNHWHPESKSTVREMYPGIAIVTSWAFPPE